MNAAERPQPVAARQRAESRAPQAAVVEIYDQLYPLSGTDAEHLQRVAAMVDQRMRAVSANGQVVDSLRVAVLAAVNLADELLRAETRCEKLNARLKDNVVQGSFKSRTDSLMGMLDEVLVVRKAG